MKSTGNSVKRDSRRGRSSAAKSLRRALIEPLEGRTMLNAVVYGPAYHDSSKSRTEGTTQDGNLYAAPALDVAPSSSSGTGGSASAADVTNPTPIPGAMAPNQVLQAYGFNNIILPNGAAATGAGETIAIVDAYHDPNIQSDLHTFDLQYFGGVDPAFSVVNLGSATNTDPTGDWEAEEALDVEWARVVAPQANIILMEAATNSYVNLTAAVDTAVSMGANVVSMSWSGGENTSYDSHFQAPNVTYVAASGDAGSPGGYPAASPYVMGVGGTSLALDANNNWSGEVGWFHSGGGVSTNEPKPSFQPATYSNGTTTGIALPRRGIPDVAYDGARESAMSVYDSYPRAKGAVFNGMQSGWFAIAGTSAGAPQWAALMALADQGRAVTSQSQLGTAQTLTTLYASPGDFHDVTSGTSVGTPNYSAGPGYDLVTGLGSPQAPLVISSLIGLAPTTQAATPNGLIAVPGNGRISLSWNATSVAASWNVYRSTDGINYSIYAGVSGTSFVDSGVTNGAAYYYQVTAVNALGESAPSSSISAIPQVPPAAPNLLSATPTNNTFSQPDFNFGVTLQWSAVTGAASYTVLRSATTGGGYAVVASRLSGTSYTDVSVYSGTQFFYVVEAVNAGGAVSGNSNERSATTIPSPPSNLTATSGNVQIALAWSASSGATSYNVLRSTTNGGPYTVIASGITTTSYTDTKLTAGVTYYYVIQAVDAGGPSANSSQASATAKHGK